MIKLSSGESRTTPEFQQSATVDHARRLYSPRTEDVSCSAQACTWTTATPFALTVHKHTYPSPVRTVKSAHARRLEAWGKGHEQPF